MTATERRAGVLLVLLRLAAALDGEAPPCAAEPASFFADDALSVERAVALCGTCPARTPCADLAEAKQERHGVWGGVHRGQRIDRRRRTSTTRTTTTTPEESR